MDYSGARGTLIHEKNEDRKSRVRLPLKQYRGARHVHCTKHGYPECFSNPLFSLLQCTVELSGFSFENFLVFPCIRGDCGHQRHGGLIPIFDNENAGTPPIEIIVSIFKFLDVIVD
jgi:hypothetical protein